MLDIYLQLRGFDVIIYFGDHGFDKDKAYLIQLLILMGNFHIHIFFWSIICCYSPLALFHYDYNNVVHIFQFFILHLNVSRFYCSDVRHNYFILKSPSTCRQYFLNARPISVQQRMREVNVELVRVRPHSSAERNAGRVRLCMRWSGK